MTDQTNKQNDGKSPVFQGCFAYFPRALKAVAMVSQYGKIKYKAPWTKKGWLRVAEGDLLDAQCRHILDRVIEGDVNSTDGDVLHQAQVAWEALAALEVSLLAGQKLHPLDILREASEKVKSSPFKDVMGDVMEARIVREQDAVSTIVPYQPSPGARYVVPGGFDLETTVKISSYDEKGVEIPLLMSWDEYFREHVNLNYWPEGFNQKETEK